MARGLARPAGWAEGVIQAQPPGGRPDPGGLARRRNRESGPLPNAVKLSGGLFPLQGLAQHGAGLLPHRELFGPALAHPRFEPPGTRRVDHEHRHRRARTRVPQPAPGAHAADPLRRHLLRPRRRAHHPPYQVLDGHEGRQSLQYPLRRRATQHVHCQRLSQVPQIGLHHPAQPVQLGQRPGRVLLRVRPWRSWSRRGGRRGGRAPVRPGSPRWRWPRIW